MSIPSDLKRAPSPGHLKMRQLLLLVHLDQERSVLRAAEAASMTQPGASKLLKELEDDLGVRLFDRHARGVVPTWYGEIMVRRARSALADLSRARDEVAALRSGFTGKASIGAVVDPGTVLVPRAVAVLKQRFPGIVVTIEIDDSDTLLGRLESGDLDIVVARTTPSHGSAELGFEALAAESHSIIARAGHPFARKRRLALQDLAGQPWIMPPSGRSLLRDRLDALFVQAGIRPPANIVETTSLPVITNLLQAADCIAALQQGTVRPHLDAGMLAVLPVTLGIRMEPFGIVTRRGHPLSPGADAMLNALRTVAATVYERAGRARAVPPAPARRN